MWQKLVVIDGILVGMNLWFRHPFVLRKGKEIKDLLSSVPLAGQCDDIRWIRNRARLPITKDVPIEPLEQDPEDAGQINRRHDATKTLQKYRQKHLLNINFDHIPIEDHVVLMFPGQGAQFVGMGNKVIDNPSSADLFDRANQFLGYNLLNVCQKGPQTKLDQTRYCQLATFVASMAAFEKLKTEQPNILDRITDAAGFSIGEYCANVVGGVLSFEDALKVIAVRAEAMHECSQLASSGMMTVRVSAASRLDDAMYNAREIARENGERAICDVANYLFCGVKVIGGTQDCLKYLEENATRFQFHVIKRLAVSGAFHTKLMLDAEKRVLDVLNGVELKAPRINVYSNYTGKIYPRRIQEIRKCIVHQISSPVKWEQIMQLLFRKHQHYKFPSYYEIGPGRQLGSMLHQVSKKAHENYHTYSC